MSKPRTRRALPNQRSVTLARRAKLEHQYAYRNKLPFVAKAKSGSEFWWNVTPSGEYEDDYQTGRAYAVAFGASAEADRPAASISGKSCLRCTSGRAHERKLIGGTTASPGASPESRSALSARSVTS